MAKEKEKNSLHKRLCLNCEREFTPMRSTKKYCSGKCRSSHHNEKKMWQVYIDTIIFKEEKELNILKRLNNFLRNARATCSR
jgi:hypothetical protein